MRMTIPKKTETTGTALYYLSPGRPPNVRAFGGTIAVLVL